MPCEDFPCCGHERGDCPRITKTGQEVFRCSQGCGRELKRNARSSICSTCMTRLQTRWRNGDE